MFMEELLSYNFQFINHSVIPRKTKSGGGEEGPAKENRIVPLITNSLAEMLLHLYALKSYINY